MSTQPLANELIEHYLDGVADAAELELLQRQLAEDPTAADAFADIARFEMLLQVHLTGASKETSLFPLPLEEERGTVTSGEDLECSETARHSPKIVNQQSVPPLIHYPLSSFINSPIFPYVFSAFVMCVGALGAWCYQVDIPSPIARANRHAAATYALSKTESAAESIGRITGMVDCRWEKGSGFRGQGVEFNKSQISNQKSLVSLGDKFVLVSGLLEITYDTGAKVILQGPVTYQVDSAVGGFLSLGKLTAKLEKKGEGEKGKAEEAGNPKASVSALSAIHHPLFTIKTPSATVTDLGTEFAVEVNREGLCDVHVFVGSVKLASHRKTGESRAEVAMAAGESARVERAGTLTRHATSRPTDFVRQMPRQDMRTEYAKMVMADKPLFYWTFDEADGTAFEQMRHLSNQKLYPMGHARRSPHNAIGSGLSLGRAADFSKGGSFRSNLLEQGEMSGAWAVEFWAQYSGDLADHTTQGIMETGADSKYGRYNPAILFSARHDSLENTFAAASAGYRPGENEACTRGGPQITDRLWHHVLLIFYGNSNEGGFGVADRVDIIVDAVPQTIARRGFSSGFNMEGLVRVGASRDDLDDSFQGRLDELAFYDLSELTVKQIETRTADMAQRHFRAAKGLQQNKKSPLPPGEG